MKHIRLVIISIYCENYTFHVNPCSFYREQSAVTLIQHVQQSKNRLGEETIAALLQTHRSWNALPDLNCVQCERSDPLTWVRKKIRTANTLQTECVWNRLSLEEDVCVRVRWTTGIPGCWKNCSKDTRHIEMLLCDLWGSRCSKLGPPAVILIISEESAIDLMSMLEIFQVYHDNLINHDGAAHGASVCCSLVLFLFLFVVLS